MPLLHFITRPKITKTLKFIAIFWLMMVVVLGCFYLYLVGQSTKQGDVVWHSCYRPTYWSWFILPPSLQLQCATVHVPVDYDNPNGKRFTLPLTRLPSQALSPIGELLLLNGGPGGHSLDMADFLVDDPYVKMLKDNFHLIGYAPRGVSPSNPAIDCGGADEEDAKAYMQACIQHTGKGILPFISSREVVHDLDGIRSQLGLDTWSMVGYSYGTKLVAKYAEHYPKQLRAGVADGVVDTSETLFTILKNQYKGSQIAFDKLSDEFIKSCQEDCFFDQTQDPNAVFVAKLAQISAKNLRDKDGDKIDSERILMIFNDNLNDSAYWADAMLMLSELEKGKTTQYNRLKFFFDLGEKGFSRDALNLVNCADSAPQLPKAQYIEQAKIVDEQAGYDDIKPKKDEDYLDACYYWQWQARDDLQENLITDSTPDLLFVAQKYDLATPLANAITMAKRFDDTLIYTPYHGHTASLSGTNACVDGYVVKYLLDPKTHFDGKLILCE